MPPGMLDPSTLLAKGEGPWTQLLLSALLLAAIVLGRRLLLRAVERRTESLPLRYRWRKVTTYSAVGLGILLLSALWFERFTSVTTFLGLVSAGLAIALKDLVSSLAGWLFLLVRKPFEVGDRIQVGIHSGDVIDLRLFKFTLLEIGNWVDADQSTGRVIHLPNTVVLSEVLINYTRGFRYIWNELPVLLTFESNWRKARTILTEIVEERTLAFSREAEEPLRKAGDRYLISYARLTPIVYTSVKDSGVLLTLRHICPPRQRRGVSNDLWEAILDRFALCDDIDFAYPTQRYYDNRSEGKPGARAGGAEPAA